MTEAQNLAKRMQIILNETHGALKAELVQSTLKDIDRDEMDWKDQPDGSVIYKLRDDSFLRVAGINLTVATQEEFGESKRIPGRLSL